VDEGKGTLLLSQEFGLLKPTVSLDINDELRANPRLALDLHGASHLLDNLLTDAQAEPCALLVPLGVLI
jgi:hypothetical protein